MTHRNLFALLAVCITQCVVATSFAIAADPPKLPAAEPPYYRVRYEASQEKGELVYGVSYTVWIPPKVKTLRGVIVHQHGCGEGACRAGQTAAFDWHWQALAAAHDCALLGPSYEQPEGADCQLWCDPRYGSDKTFHRALDELATQSNHPELAKVPWALWGHSGGATWVGSMLMLHPERCIAVWMRSGIPNVFEREGMKQPVLPVPEAALSVPMMCNLGTQEGVSVKEGRFAAVWPRVESFFGLVRKRGALLGVSVDPLSSHDCGNQRYLAVPWFDECLKLRLPTDASGKLKSLSESDLWLAPLLGSEAVAIHEYKEDKLAAMVLPNQRVAKAWQAYAKDSQVPDETPPAAPTDVLWRPGTLTWQTKADLESGLAAFVILRDGKEIQRVPATPNKNIGRSNFQKNSYSDTPSQPLATMSVQLSETDGSKIGPYQVVAINTVGLKSEPSLPAHLLTDDQK